MRFSKRCQYGIKAAVFLSRQAGKGYCQSREIALAENLPSKFLESILLTLRASGVLVSKVGAGGGYRLSEHPAQMPVRRIFEALENHENGVDELESDPTDGSLAVRVLDERMRQAHQEAIGSLTLEELVRLVEEEAQARASSLPSR